jgi:hypothetical protein
LICTVMERSVLPYLAGVAWLRVSGNSSSWYIVKVHKTLPPAGVKTLIYSCCHSRSTATSLPYFITLNILYSLPRWGCLAASFWQFQQLVYRKCTQNTVTDRGQNSNRLMLSSQIHCHLAPLFYNTEYTITRERVFCSHALKTC